MQAGRYGALHQEVQDCDMIDMAQQPVHSLKTDAIFVQIDQFCQHPARMADDMLDLSRSQYALAAAVE